MSVGFPNSNAAPVTRVAIVQQVVPHYRLPVFDLLARQPGIALTVWSAQRAQGSLKHVPSPGSYREGLAPLRMIAGFCWQPALVSIAKSDAHDVVIYSWNARLLHLPRALRTCRNRGVPTLLWGHGYSKDESAIRRRTRNRLLNLSDGCLLYNSSAARQLASEGFDPKRLFVAQNALDQGPIDAARTNWLNRPDALRDFRRSHGLPEHATALFISRLEADKRIDLLLRAFAIVVRARPEARLAVIGRGSEEAALRTLSMQLGIERNILFAGSVYEEEHLAPWLLSASCMAYPVAIGLSIFHAFGYGLPVVTSDDIASHNPEIEAFRPNENGLAYRDGDIDDFAAKILACMGDEASHRRMREAALRTVRSPDGYCLDRMVKGFTDAIAFVRESRR